MTGRPIRRSRTGIISIPRPIERGVYFLKWPLEQRFEQYEGGAGFEDPREHDWSQWQGPEAKRKIGFR